MAERAKRREEFFPEPVRRALPCVFADDATLRATEAGHVLDLHRWDILAAMARFPAAWSWPQEDDLSPFRDDWPWLLKRQVEDFVYRLAEELRPHPEQVRVARTDEDDWLCMAELPLGRVWRRSNDDLLAVGRGAWLDTATPETALCEALRPLWVSPPGDREEVALADRLESAPEVVYGEVAGRLVATDGRVVLARGVPSMHRAAGEDELTARREAEERLLGLHRHQVCPSCRSPVSSRIASCWKCGTSLGGC